MSISKKFPLYVAIMADTNSSCHCLKRWKVDGEIATYWRHGGQWSVEAAYVGGVLKTRLNQETTLISNKRLIRVSREEWLDDNGIYANNKYGPGTAY